MIDLDSAEGLGSSARRQPLFIAIVIDHHSGPSLANTGLTERETARQRKYSTLVLLSMRFVCSSLTFSVLVLFQERYFTSLLKIL